MKQAAERLKQAVGAGIFLTDEPMSRHTTFRTGGPADIYIEPSGVEELKQVLDICREENVAYTIIGNGSNLLVGDGGYRGVLISFGKPFAQVTIEGAQVRTGAGALLSAVAKQVLNASLTGFEFAAGIPGTIGGAVVMNAGAYGGELCQVLREATVLTPEGEVKTLPAEELELGYRTSCVQKNGYIVLEAVLQLQPGNADDIRAAMGIPECRQYLQAPGRLFRRQTDPGCRASRLPCGRRPGVREALRLCDQPGSCHLCRYPFSVQTGTGKGESAVWCEAGTGSKAFG